jgi:hypothetical protein
MTFQNTSKVSLWQNHIESWRSSGKSQIAYCRDQELCPNQFSYWKNKLKDSSLPLSDVDANKPTQKTAFVPVRLATPASAEESTLCLELPNGMRLSGINAHSAALLKQVVDALL